MKKKELEYFINNMLINKEDVLLSIRDYIEYCKETKEENWSEKKREIIIKILFNFYDRIESFDFPVINSQNWYYEYFWNRDGINADTKDIKNESKYIINNVILEYGALASWKLSKISHKEISWINSRKGLKDGENGNRKIKLEDIREDAKKVRPYDYVWDMYYDEFEDVIQ